MIHNPRLAAALATSLHVIVVITHNTDLFLTALIAIAFETSLPLLENRAWPGDNLESTFNSNSIF